jgi:GntR family transcriptional regulator / MocR family aminotransferase
MYPPLPLSGLSGSLTRQVYQGLRRAILSGAYAAGQRLPSTRDLAKHLGVSRPVVVLAYEQLLAEGYVLGRPGSGTYVAQGLEGIESRPSGAGVKVPLAAFGVAAEAAARRMGVKEITSPSTRYDFAYAEADTEIFPFNKWRRTLLRVERKHADRDVGCSAAAGIPELRAAICGHLRRTRAVNCEHSQIIVSNGSQQALDLIARVLVDRGDNVAIEDPHYQGTREILSAFGAHLCPVAIDRLGLNPRGLPREARLLFVTPSHQFPTGVILPLERRLAILKWARQSNSIVVENDRDGEFRYAGRPLESMQSLDTEGRTIYVGTFSRTIFPALRIGYLIVPKALTAAFAMAKWMSDQQSAVLEQQTLAEFMTSGQYDLYLRRLLRRNSQRRAALLDALNRFLCGRVEVTGHDSGTHVVLWPHGALSESTIISRAAKLGVRVYPTSHCYSRRPARTGIILGYSRLPVDTLRQGIRLLGEVL